MTGRDKIVLAVIACLAILAGVWFELVSPERQKASEAQAQVESARSALATAQSNAAAARGLSARQAEVKRSAIALRPAVPVRRSVPTLIDEISSATGQRNVDFSSIQSSAVAAAGASSKSQTQTVEGMTPMPFAFEFTGNFFQLESLLRRFASYVHATRNGTLVVDGRLIVFSSLSLQPVTEGSGHGKTFKLQGQINGTAFMTPAPSATSATPAGTTTPTASSGSTSSATPAVVSGGKP